MSYLDNLRDERDEAISLVAARLVIDVFDRYGEQDLATFAKTYDELFEFVMSNDPVSGD